MILRHALARAALPVARRSLATTSLALASRHTRTRPSRASLQQPRRHPAAAPHSTPAEEALTPTPEESELPPVSRLPAHVPHDSNGIIDSASYSSAEQLRQMLAQPALVVGRQMEMMNIFLGYEQANRYHITSSTGELLGYLMEEDSGIGSAIKRQMLRTHRPFKATVLSKEGQVLLIVRRPFAWINSRIYVCTPADNPAALSSSAPASSSSSAPVPFAEPLPPSQVAEDQIIGETQQVFHLYRRIYDHFLQRDGTMEQFASTDAGFLSFDFIPRDEQGRALGSVNRNFMGFGREIFTDSGSYVVRFEAVADEEQAALEAPKDESKPSTELARTSPSTELTVPVPSITYDQRAVFLALAVTADIDYFSRHSGHGGMGGAGFMPVYMPGMGGTGDGAEGEAGAGAAGAGAEGAEVGRVEGQGDAPVVNEDGGWSGTGGGVDGGGWGGWGSSQPSGGEAPSAGGAGGWGDEPMQDPWASNDGQAEDGGTWSWGDIFPSDD